jgi:hypothetical protein
MCGWKDNTEMDLNETKCVCNKSICLSTGFIVSSCVKRNYSSG